MACSLSTFTVTSQAVSALAYSNETQRLQQLFIQLSQYGNLGLQGNHQTANRAFTTYVRPVVGHYLGRYWSTIPPSGLPDMHTLKISLNWFSVDLPNVYRVLSHFVCSTSRSPQGWNTEVASFKVWFNHDVFYYSGGGLLIFAVIAFSVSSIVSPFTLVVIILDFIRSIVMLTALWTLLSAATLMSGTGYQLMSWTVTVSQYLSEDWQWQV